MKKFKAKRLSFNFEYEFLDGTVETVEYLEPNTKQIDKSLSLEDDVQERLSFTKEVLKECLKADDEIVSKIIKEQTSASNIYDFKSQLDSELGKLKEKD